MLQFAQSAGLSLHRRQRRRRLNLTVAAFDRTSVHHPQFFPGSQIHRAHAALPQGPTNLPAAEHRRHLPTQQLLGNGHTGQMA